MKIPMRGFYEHSALSGWRRVMQWRPGMRAVAKRSYNKRVRQLGRKAASAAE
jgi:hypothetical protein